MTTPARNVHEILSQSTGYTVYSGNSPGLHLDTGTSQYAWNDSVRPVSGNAARIEGFKLCRPWSNNWRSFRFQSGGVRYTNNANHAIYSWDSGSFWTGGGASNTPPTVPTPSDNMINATVVKALNKLKSQDLHLGNFVAEGHKTVEMIANTARTIANSINSFRRGNPVAAWNAVKQFERGGLPRNLWCKIPNGWLQVQYGWNPLMSDMVGAMLHLARRSRFEIPFIKVSAHGQDEIETIKPCYGQLASQANCTFTTKMDVWVNLFYRSTNPQLAELSSLGLINPAEIIWELTPYSFVVDWFLPVASWMSALTADVGYSFVSGSKSTKAVMHFKESSIIANPSGVHDLSISNPGYTGSAGAFGRTCFASSPVPGLYVKSPISTVHALNAIALLAQSIR